jgi:UDP-N-acetylmuramoyl-tripeptide--D-alanyl-D-alanine ligase
MTTPFLTLQKMHQAIPGSTLLHVSEKDFNTPIQRVSTDSRKIQPGDFFIAIKGDKFDGNAFLGEVFKKGAFAALADHAALVPENQPTLLVENTLIALQQLATHWRLQTNPLLVLVTGSNGKTTVKEMIAGIFRQAFGEDATLATPGNLNNEIGLPLTLLGLNQQHEGAVIELGMNHPGETRFLAQIASPNISLINNAQREHQEFMQSVEAVALEHSDALSALSDDGIAIFPADAPYTTLWQNVCQTRTYYDFALITQGEVTQARVFGYWLKDGALCIELPVKPDQSKQKIEVRLATLGDHNAKNAIAAAAVAWAANIQSDLIREGLEKFQPVAGRMRSHELPNFGHLGHLIDDTYNANPDSVLAAIDVLVKMPGKRWLILGDMGEVGDKGDLFHQEIGAYAKKMGVHSLYATGVLTQHTVDAFELQSNNYPTAFTAQGIYFQDQKTLLKKLKNDLLETQEQLPSQAVSILVKGSRFTKMERIVNCLLKEESLCF